MGRQTASRAWAGTAQLLERRYLVRGSVCCLALTLRRSLRPVYPDFVCANSAGALCPGCPEGFAAFLPRTDRSDAERTRGPPAEQK